ncbi:MAG TPA: hypothetical protein VF701_09595 [Thermoanaerobaculia bacterium]
MRNRLLLAFSILLTTALLAQSTPPLGRTKLAVEHTPNACVRASELPLMQVGVTGEGELRGYFRRVNTSDWCSVEGVNDGPFSRVVFPRFDAGDEFEYYFVLLDGSRVVAKSPRIFRARVTGDCETAWARHVMRMSVSCGDDAVGASTAAALVIGSDEVDEPPTPGSPDSPTS